MNNTSAVTARYAGVVQLARHAFTHTTVVHIQRAQLGGSTTFVWSCHTESTHGYACFGNNCNDDWTVWASCVLFGAMVVPAGGASRVLLNAPLPPMQPTGTQTCMRSRAVQQRRPANASAHGGRVGTDVLVDGVHAPCLQV